MIKIFYDTETTGINPMKSSIHQIAGLIEIDDFVVETFDIKVRPHPKAIYEEAALTVCKKTKEEILGYQSMEDGLREFKGVLTRHIDKYDPQEKAHLVGFNNRGFDDLFLQMWFKLCNDQYLWSWFWVDTLDILPLASQYLLHRRPQMPSFKLKRVATELGIIIDKEKLHDALYDAYLTREIYRIVTGLEFEI